MNDADRQFLTKWGGECWHEWNADENKCSCGVKGRMLANYSCDYENRTFDTWEDFGWLWEKFCRKYYGRFICWICGKRHIAWIDWEYKSPADRCQLICDFLREQEGKG